MKKLLLPLLLFAVLTKAQNQQDYYNGIDPIIGMKETQSESVRAVDEILKNNKPSKIAQKLEKSQEMVENLEVAKFEDVYQPPSPPENRNYNQSGNAQDNNVDPFSSSEDKTPSFKGERINVDEYYNQQPDGSYIKKDIGYQKTSSHENNNTILIVVILIVGTGIIGALALSQKKPATGVVPLKNSLIQMFEENYRENYVNFGSDSSFAIIASSSLHELCAIVKRKCSFLANQNNLEYGQVSILIDDCFEEVYYKYFER